jgi:ribose-phosphate pyrophosphokinase
MEMFVLLDALWRAKANIFTVIMPYYPYARQDRRKGEITNRTAVTAQLFPRLLQCAADKIPHACIVEPHDQHVEGFCPFPVDIIPVLHLFIKPLSALIPELEKASAASPDRGGYDRTTVVATLMQTPEGVSLINKRRLRPGESKAVQFTGDVHGRDVVTVDDMIDGAGSMVESVRILKEQGAKRVIACAVHGLLSGQALERIMTCDVEKVIVTDTLEHRPEVLACPKIQVISVAHLIASAIQILATGESVRDLGRPEP